MITLQTAIFLIASAAVVAVSAYMNWSFGLTKAPDEFNAHIWGVLSVALDAVKTMLPFLIASQITRHCFKLATFSSAIFAILILISLASSLGFSANSKAGINDKHMRIATANRVNHDRLDRLHQQLRALGDSPSIVTIDFEIVTIKRHHRWSSSSQCHDATENKSIALCDHYHALIKQRNSAQNALKYARELSAKIDALELQLTDPSNNKTTTDADPQANLISRLTTLNGSIINDAIAIMFALMLEFISAFGFFMAFDYYRSAAVLTAQPTNPKHDIDLDIAQPTETKTNVIKSPALLAAPDNGDHLSNFLQSAIITTTDARLPAKKLHEHYRQWCQANQQAPLNIKVFGEYLRDHTDLKKKRIGGCVLYLGISLV